MGKWKVLLNKYGRWSTPVDVLPGIKKVSDREQAMLDNPEAMESLHRGLEQAANGEVIRYDPRYNEKLVAEMDDDDA